MIALLLVLLACLAPIVGEAQPRPARVGLLGFAEEPRLAAFRAGLTQGLATHGYPEGTVDVVEATAARGNREQARVAADGLVRRQVAVLVAIGTELTRAAREVTAELPVVFVTPGDPVAAGVVSSLARPGGHTTGVTVEYPELSGKRLELLKELAPRTRRVLAIFDPADASPRQAVAAARVAAARLGLVLVERPAPGPAALRSALDAVAEADAVLGIPGGFPSAHHDEIIRRAHAHRLPTVFPAGHSTARAVAVYGASDASVVHDAARLVARILKGTRAGDLPVERPTKIELVLNRTSAAALGLAMPPALVLRADRVVE